jgi:hypothetical protein
MQDQLSYLKFHDWVDNFNLGSQNENFKFDYIVKKVREYISNPEDGIFYPQNIFMDDEDTNLLFFKDDRIYRITGNLNKVFFEVFYLKDIVDYNFEVSKEDGIESVTLNIFFTLDRQLTLNNSSDTNEHWSYVFSNKIKGIFKLFLNC